LQLLYFLRVAQVLTVFGAFLWRALKGRYAPAGYDEYTRAFDPGPEPDPARQPALYTAAAAACRLADVGHGGRAGRRTLWGRSGELRVRLEQHPGPGREDKNRSFETRVFIEAIEGRMVPVTLRRQSRGFLGRDLSAREIEIGDNGFDDEFLVTGPHTFLRALLDDPARRLLLTLLLEMDLEVVRGRLRGTLPVTTSWPVHEQALARMLGYMLDVARRLERPSDLVRRLADNARLDPLPEVRLQNLLTLVREYPEEPATEEALAAACGDASDWIRVRAATALGERGRATLLEVASRDPPDDAAAPQAIGVLGKALPPERVREILTRALRGRHQGTARACLAALGVGGSGDAVALMAKVMSVERGEVAVAAADALAMTGSPAAEGPLLAALARDIPELGVAAARGLGRVGTAAAVLTLKEAEARAGGSPFGRAARQAIAEIQARLPGASPGQLSIATPEAGALSLVQDERGRLSLPAPDERE
jgi:HEAT repeat protein